MEIVRANLYDTVLYIYWVFFLLDRIIIGPWTWLRHREGDFFIRAEVLSENSISHEEDNRHLVIRPVCKKVVLSKIGTVHIF